MMYLPSEAFEHQINELVYEPTLVWPKQNVTIAFVNGNTTGKLEFRRIFFEWFKCTHIHFTEVSLNQRADIRVGFKLNGQQSTSLIGSLSMKYSISLTSKRVYRDYRRNKDPSMIVGSIKKRSILHEGGHSLAAKHEHSHPMINISWNENYLKQEMPPYASTDFIRINFLHKSSLNQSLGPFDE